MFAELARLERRYHALLPVQRLRESPGKDLLEAAKAWSEEVWKISGILGPLSLPNAQLNKGLQLAQRPVFICGVHRSGTTLVRDLLDAHPALAVLPAEGNFLTNLAKPLQRMPPEKGECFLATEWLRRLANPINQAPYWLLGRSTLAGSAYVDYARAFRYWYPALEKRFQPQTSFWPHLAVVLAYATCYQQAGAGLAAKYWVDKTPTNERYLPKIWQDFPDAHIIHIVRAPVDVFRSRKQMEPSLNLQKCLQDLELSYQVALKQSRLNPGKYLLIHYEDLCKNPQETVAGITDFLQIDLLPCLYTPTVGGKPGQVNSSFTLTGVAGGILHSQANLHKQNQVPGQEGKLLSAYLFKPAARLGYPLKPIGKLSRWGLKLWLQMQYGMRGILSFFKHYKQLARKRE
ncbi:MAG: sulfotransferase family protein [Adhaeribacter sp.]